MNGLPVAGPSRGTARPQAGESTLRPFIAGEGASAVKLSFRFRLSVGPIFLFLPLCSRYLVFENSLKYNEEKTYTFYSPIWKSNFYKE